ncbi:glycine--tRNA ligase [Candidatus Shikimatogenerans bostrichidophilus]|uniref:glycine--tRNA ligase n=1 Tax=Candidatus Shikimatogenerans bostrichidophilus TaxID=2943807 RepID=UPI002966E532
MNYNKKLKLIINHAKIYGFIFKSSEIYNGIKSIYDYGPQGIEMKNNIKKFWWNYMVKYRNNIVGIDSSILMNNKVWKASGHIKNFNELFIINNIDNKIYIIDQLINNIIDNKLIKIKNKNKIKLIFNYYLINKNINKLNLFLKKIIKKYNLSKLFKWENINNINLMFKTKLNSFDNDQEKYTYLRPETAQGIFVNIKNVKLSNRLKFPFGIAQIGKSFRNEIISKQFIFRTREFEQMEMQYFFYPGQEKKWYKYWIKSRLKWFYYLINKKKKYKLKIHNKLSHYCKFAIDIEFKILNKFKELEGIHFRKNYDLKNHNNLSKKKLYFYDNKAKKNYIPYVIETSLGLDRLFYSILTNSLKIENINNKKRIYLKLPKFISPIKIAIFPIIKNNKIIKISKNIFNSLKYKFTTIYDENKSIGKRYKIQDSFGTPYCITIDFLTLNNKTVSIRFRDNMKQIRCKIKNLIKYFKKKFDISLFFKKNI